MKKLVCLALVTLSLSNLMGANAKSSQKSSAKTPKCSDAKYKKLINGYIKEKAEYACKEEGECSVPDEIVIGFDGIDSKPETIALDTKNKILVCQMSKIVAERGNPCEDYEALHDDLLYILKGYDSKDTFVLSVFTGHHTSGADIKPGDCGYE